MINFNTLTEKMTEVAYECGKIILSADEEHLGTKIKSSRRDLVTDYDVRVQKYAVEKLSSYFSNATFFCEENTDNDDLQGELVFVIDPIDGTANFVFGLKHSCVSIGCLSYGKAVAGVVYDPYNDELFSAYENGGAYLNGKRIEVTANALGETIAVFGSSPYNPDRLDDTLNKIRTVFGKCLDVRRSGSAALDICYVACGRYGLYFESVVSLWDYLAAFVILKEAGGDICNYDSKALPLSPEKTSIVAGSKLTVKESGLL